MSKCVTFVNYGEELKESLLLKEDLKEEKKVMENISERSEEE